MMRSTILLTMAFGLLQTGCSSLGLGGEKGAFKESVLSNANPAPAALSPPNYDDGQAPMIDAVHMGSQADYHFTLGEALSFEGQFEKAIEEFKLTLVYDPSSISV